MKDIVQQVKKNIAEYNLIQQGDRIVVGVSGGPDSVFLLYVLCMFKKKMHYDIEVAHINHLIRAEAVEDQELVKNMCEKYGVNFHVLAKDVKKLAKENKQSVEECGRDVRYAFFEEIKKKTKANKIAVAHNLGDNAETIIMNLLRGAGTIGLAGMDYESNGIIRPMLSIDKKDIIEYLNKKGIEYKIDRTNLENDYTRNKVRNDLIKKIEKEYNPNFKMAISKASELLKDKEKLAEEYIGDLYTKVTLKGNDEIILDIKKIEHLSNCTKRELVLKCIRELLGSTKGIQKVYIDDIVRIINSKISEKEYIEGNKFNMKVLHGAKAKFTKTLKEDKK